MFDHLKSWKTTIIGVILLLFGVILFSIDKPIEGSMCVASSLGFFAAKDSTVTGVGDNAKTESEITTAKGEADTEDNQ